MTNEQIHKKYPKTVRFLFGCTGIWLLSASNVYRFDLDCFLESTKQRRKLQDVLVKSGGGKQKQCITSRSTDGVYLAMKTKTKKTVACAMLRAAPGIRCLREFTGKPFAMKKTSHVHTQGMSKKQKNLMHIAVLLVGGGKAAKCEKQK
eukprot:GEMP01050304.1.p2 GENE.GEMP01050304.1~~GEMP01050304.1.p2  ORF type:complete len:148 (-),score=8.74 GEMP01050304.1:1145-1588(-)